jgi:hypothetical protein
MGRGIVARGRFAANITHVIKISEAIAVGFFPKITQPKPDGFGNPVVKEICSVSECISAGPADWVMAWKHNEWGFYASEELAYQVAGHAREKFDIYAYKLYPFRYGSGGIEPLTIESGTIILPTDYACLGYDVVTNSGATHFECSPLSCNNAAERYTVNEFCLIGDPADAYRVWLAIGQDGSYEPGPYYLVEVHRKRSRA